MPQIMDHTSEIEQAIFKIDPMFDKEKFIAWSKEVYVTLQQAWMERDWSKIRPFEKEELFAQHQKLLQEYIDQGRINMMERINVNQAFLQKYERNSQYEFLTVYMQVRMRDYIIDEKTKKGAHGRSEQRLLYEVSAQVYAQKRRKDRPGFCGEEHCGLPALQARPRKSPAPASASIAVLSSRLEITTGCCAICSR